jgi:hypothetical protein
MNEHGEHASSDGAFVVCPNHPDSPLRITKFVRMCMEIRYHLTENIM